ncbi:tRNA-dependent cyclodipeptide synthase [Staphylococcus delphini]|uniref:tRNA-dependent cyclodipeptide synthase n=1 Tax=Staphylococcus delphini TaxID=53344 RepID=UPI0021D1420A|nr:tRNA-dependent cyclodipeptide synthase [Staphylococcus delphini]UXS30439.1 tRNA-dependent cyclodipeptide synthase [Staphylococcus delphini]
MSPFTSKYNEKYIRKIIQWANNNFDEFTILLGGEESKNILECLGYSTTKANRKVRKEINRQIRFCEDEWIYVKNTDTEKREFYRASLASLAHHVLLKIKKYILS